jgi:hypothetical protein
MTIRERTQEHSHEFLVIQFLCFSCHQSRYSSIAMIGVGAIDLDLELGHVALVAPHGKPEAGRRFKACQPWCKQSWRRAKSGRSSCSTVWVSGSSRNPKPEVCSGWWAEMHSRSWTRFTGYSRATPTAGLYHAHQAPDLMEAIQQLAEESATRSAMLQFQAQL